MRPHTTHTPRWSAPLMPPVGRPLLFAILTVILLLAILLPFTASAEAAHTPHHAPTLQVTPTATATTAERTSAAGQIVFSMGELASVDAGTLTLTFADGQVETYQLAPDTTIQAQNGDAQTVADLDVGNLVVVITREDDPTALTIVNSGDAGFHEAGPADIRGHQNECMACKGTSAP